MYDNTKVLLPMELFGNVPTHSPAVLVKDNIKPCRCVQIVHLVQIASLGWAAHGMLPG